MSTKSWELQWLRRSPSRRSRENLQLVALVRASFEQSDRTYGSPRVWRDLRALGQRCGRHRVARLMRAEGLRARHRRRRLPSDAGQRLPSAIAPNLLERQFEATAPNQRWVADFTYIWTHEGWLYFAVVLDLYSRLVVGWSMSSRMTAQLVTDALVMAVWRRGDPTEGSNPSLSAMTGQRPVSGVRPCFPWQVRRCLARRAHNSESVTSRPCWPICAGNPTRSQYSQRDELPGLRVGTGGLTRQDWGRAN